jgi:hydroxymethylbilane synthase
MNKPIIIATRKSPMAIAQTQQVKQSLEKHHPQHAFELLAMTTEGDRRQDASLARIGGKGLFIKALEKALLNTQAHFAVHSAKDMPMCLPDGLVFGAFVQRDNPYDAFVSNQYAHLEALPTGAIVGTSSLRRQAQLLHARPDLTIKPLRGNANTRLAKLDKGEYDAILLAAAGLERLKLENRITQLLDDERFIPAVTQGILALECRAKTPAISSLLAPLNHAPTVYCARAERAVSHALNASCTLPLGAHADIEKTTVTLNAMVASPDGLTVITAQAHQDITEVPEKLGELLANKLLAQGAERILSACRP